MELTILKINSKNPCLINQNELIGDLLYLEEYAIDILKPEEHFNYKILKLNRVLGDSWQALVQANIMTQEYVNFLKEEFIYECPYIEDTKYYYCMPICILSDNLEKYRTEPKGKNWRMDMALDDTWMKDEEIFNLGLFSDLKNGHGYDMGRLASDGYSEKIKIIVKLSNDDLMVLQTFLWFNK